MDSTLKGKSLFMSSNFFSVIVNVIKKGCKNENGRFTPLEMYPFTVLTLIVMAGGHCEKSKKSVVKIRVILLNNFISSKIQVQKYLRHIAIIWHINHMDFSQNKYLNSIMVTGNGYNYDYLGTD